MKKRRVAWRNFRSALRSVPLVMAWSFFAAAATAGSAGATRECLGIPPTCTVDDTHAKFLLPNPQTVSWEANYTGSPQRFWLSTISTSQASRELTKSVGQTMGTEVLPAGIYFISIRTNLMGPGSYSVFGPGVVGEPHITTLNGVHYDFQSAGEFVVLRHPSGFELQTRTTPIATATRPGVDPYSGLAACVSINSAVAARVGRHRVTYQPNISGRPDPSGLQLRVDGKLTVLGRLGKNLDGGGRLARTGTPGELMIEFPDRSSVTVTPNWWADQSLWYLNISMWPPQESRGIAGDILPGSWLPLLPDGTSLGPRPDSLHDRFIALYQKFADAWRVTGDSSLFDYAPGTSTRTYTMQSWPPEETPCELPFTVPVQGASKEVAEKACQNVLGPTAHKNCVFDVMATGEAGFGRSYVLDQGPPGKKVKIKPYKQGAVQ